MAAGQRGNTNLFAINTFLILLTIMSLQPGQSAPDFTLFTDEMQPFRLSDQRGEPVVLLFFPGAFTRVCTEELRSVSERLQDFAGVQVVGLSTDAPPVLAEFRRANDLKIPLLSDHDADVCSAYGARYESGFTKAELTRIAKRAAFVVDAEGTLRYTEVLEDAGRQPDFEAVQRVVDECVGEAAEQ